MQSALAASQAKGSTVLRTFNAMQGAYQLGTGLSTVVDTGFSKLFSLPSSTQIVGEVMGRVSDKLYSHGVQGFDEHGATNNWGRAILEAVGRLVAGLDNVTVNALNGTSPASTI